MLPDDCGGCAVCGQPVYGAGGGRVLCADCEPPRDARGRFIARDSEDARAQRSARPVAASGTR